MRHLFEQLISDMVPVHVVDRLKAVQVQKQYGKLTVVSLGSVYRLLQPISQ